MKSNGVRHFLDLIDIPAVELRGMIAAGLAMKARRKLQVAGRDLTGGVPERDG